MIRYGSRSSEAHRIKKYFVFIFKCCFEKKKTFWKPVNGLIFLEFWLAGRASGLCYFKKVALNKKLIFSLNLQAWISKKSRFLDGIVSSKNHHHWWGYQLAQTKIFKLCWPHKLKIKLSSLRFVYNLQNT